MSDEPHPVYGRPPVDVSDEEQDRWVEGFLDAILGPESDSERSDEPGSGEGSDG